MGELGGEEKERNERKPHQERHPHRPLTAKEHDQEESSQQDRQSAGQRVQAIVRPQEIDDRQVRPGEKEVIGMERQPLQPELHHRQQRQQHDDDAGRIERKDWPPAEEEDETGERERHREGVGHEAPARVEEVDQQEKDDRRGQNGQRMQDHLENLRPPSARHGHFLQWAERHDYTARMQDKPVLAL